jgi:hypothetical protein
MNEQTIALAIDYAVMRTGCEKALALLEDPDASGFDADKVIDFLRTILGVK